MKPIMTADQVGKAFDELYQAAVSHLPSDRPIAIVGVRTRGEVLARRFVERLTRDNPGLSVDFGILDITFYRDDLSRRRGVPMVRATEIDFDLDDAWVLLIDDVIETGRSVRAALDALHDFGRPKFVRLAVLIDRGGRELPIAADFVGKKYKPPRGGRIQLKLRETDGQESAYLVQPGG
jgi:pyrimidine operon attenuation protein/uracil phosphoribosyltransferase